MSNTDFQYDQQPDPRGQVDTDGRDEFEDVPQQGGVSDQPDAVTRENRDNRGALTPAEERAALVQRIRDRREAERAARDAGDDQQVSERGYERQPVEQQQQPQGKPKNHRLVVNGQEYFVDDDELIRRAQLSTASTEALSEAKATIAEARRVRQEALEEAQRLRQSALAQPPVTQRAGEQTPSQGQPQTQGPERLREIAEAIQTGDAEDAEKALQELISGLRAEQPQQQPPPQPLNPVEVADLANARRAEAEAADWFRQYFEQTYPAFVGHPGLIMETQIRMHRETLNELRNLVGRNGRALTEAEMQPVRQDLEQALRWLAKYHDQGIQRRDGRRAANPFEIFQYSADAVTRELGIQQPQRQQIQQRQPAPAVGNQSRQEQRVAEKRQLVEPRPAQTGQRQGSGYQRLTPEQSRKRAVDQRRQANGFDRVA